jgi:hypothetical protein
VSRGVDDVQLVVIPEARRRGGLNRDATLLFLLHEIGGGRAVVHLPDLVDLAGELEDALGGRRLAGVHVGEDADVSVFTEVFHRFARPIGRFATRPIPRKRGCASPRSPEVRIHGEIGSKQPPAVPRNGAVTGITAT